MMEKLLAQLTTDQLDYHEKGYPIIDTKENIYLSGSQHLPQKQPTEQELYAFFDDLGAIDDPTTYSMMPAHAMTFALGATEFESKPWDSDY